jgi:hypothetical protein
VDRDIDREFVARRAIGRGMLGVLEGKDFLIINGDLRSIDDIAPIARAVLTNLDAVVCWEVECSVSTPIRKINYSIRPIGKQTDISRIVNRYGGYDFSVPFTSLSELNVLAPFFL